ncbi:MAG TPA: LLM class flavin-dependent oxidoreductase [Thermomicrobiales bacterium]|nr:LLM class flavin-dependent oxidoreductase [Thermomicrobiales bacterium]
MTGREGALAPALSVAFQGDKPPAAYAELGALVEGYGFGTVSVYADLLFQPPLGPLLAIAGATRRIRLGPACLNPYTLHPVELAGQLAYLDAASDGRAYLGLARGAWLDSLGIPQPRPVAALRDAVAIVRRLLRGERAPYRGEVFRLEEYHARQYLVARPDLPVLLGGWGPRIVALAGEVADELKVGGSANPALVPVMRARLASGAARAGRAPGDIGLVFGAVTVVAEDDAAARALARREVARYLPVVAGLDPTVAVEPDLLARVAEAVRRDDFAAAGALIPDDLLDRFAFAGSPRRLVAQVQALLAAGADRIEFGTPHGLTAREGLRLLGERVLPAFRQ